MYFSGVHNIGRRSQTPKQSRVAVPAVFEHRYGNSKADLNKIKFDGLIIDFEVIILDESLRF